MKPTERKTYKVLLDKTIIPMNLSEDKQQELYAPLWGFVTEHTPHQLFRYRSCSELNIDAFYNHQIWTSRGIDMNDDYDARIYYNKKKINKWLNSYFETDDSLSILNAIRDGAEPPPNIAAVPYAREFVNFIKGTTREQLKLGSTNFRKFLNDNFLCCVTELVELAQKTLKFACFSENINSVSMWGLYADNGKGFALSYDFRNNNFCDCPQCPQLGKSCMFPKRCHLMPMIYSNLRFDATNYMIYFAQYRILQKMALSNGFIIPPNIMDTIIPCPDSFMSSKVALYKSTEWRQEKEWRLFCTSEDPNFGLEPHSYIRKSPTALYLGRNIKPINEKLLITIAHEQQIPIYKMILPENSQKYKLVPKLLSK